MGQLPGSFETGELKLGPSIRLALVRCWEYWCLVHSRKLLGKCKETGGFASFCSVLGFASQPGGCFAERHPPHDCCGCISS